VSAREFVKKLVLPYEALRTLYEGGSEVRLYKNELIGTMQVGKRIDTLGIENTVAVNEGALLKLITHDNIVPIHEVVLVEGFQSPMGAIELIMPYYPQGSICDALERGHRYSVREASRHIQATLQGLGELHENHHILHRDVKSPNVLLSGDHTLVKISDLGIAVAMTDDGTAEAYPRVQLYSPPEMLVARRVDRRSDIYGVGLLFAEMLTSPFPYDSYSIADCENRLAKGRSALRVEDLDLSPHVPRGLRRVVNKATHRDPEHRYSTARAMSTAIAAARLVDWERVVEMENEVIWEGDSSTQRQKRFRVEAARRRRGGGWRLRGLSQKNRWQRVVDDQIVDDLHGTQATALFDHVVAIATA
jgi:serine/threonine protein kinase